MPFDHSNATATVSITGLALGCYNLETNNYEVGFIRHDPHVLSITVNSPTVNNQNAEITFVLDQNHRIFIETEAGIRPQEPFYQPTANFDRNAEGQDHEDFQWIVDLDKELNGDQPVPLKHPELPVTEMYISHPVLYADPDGRALGVFNLVDTEDEKHQIPFGEICEVIKGDIACEDGGAVILRVEGPLGFSYRLPRIAGKTHNIIMKNVCPQPAGNDGPSDFTVYYSVVDNTSGKRFDLQDTNGPAHNPDGVCNGSTLSKTSRLFPLP